MRRVFCILAVFNHFELAMNALPYELQLGLRYTRAKRRNGFISFISFSSIAGIALGVMALIVVMSIMNGFQHELRERILSMTAHMQITGYNQRLHHWRRVAEQVRGTPHVVGMAPVIEEQAMLSHGKTVKGVVVRAINPEWEPQVSGLDRKMVSGSLSALQTHKYGILLGKELAESLGVTVGDKVTLIAPEASVTVVGVLPRFKRMTVVGIFSAGMYEYDSGLAVIRIADARKIYRYPKDTVTALTLRLDDLFAVEAVRKALAQRLSETLYTIDWTQRHANFFKAVHMEKRMMFIVLALIIMVAAFNIVSMMVMVVTDKQADIAILKTLGATPVSIMLLFMVQGIAIGTVGILIGVTAGVALALNLDVVVPFIEHLLGIRFFPPDIYYISEVPSRLEWGDVEAVAVLAFLLTLVATLYPSWRAARIQPAEALRYE